MCGKPYKNVLIRLSPELLHDLDAVCCALGWSRTHFIRESLLRNIRYSSKTEVPAALNARSGAYK